jgi:hypothetical protein
MRLNFAARARRTGAHLLLAALVTTLTLTALPAGAQQTVSDVETNARRIKQVQKEMMRQGAQRRFERMRTWAKEVRKAKQAKKPAPPSALRRRPAIVDPEDIATAPRPAADRTAVSATQVVPTNVRANDRAGDSSNSGQAEQSIASYLGNVLVAWNDGQGFVTGLDTQGYAWSVDNGATFTDGGTPLLPPGYPSAVWTSDPVVIVNEKTGDFYYCGLLDLDAATSAVGVARGHFAGGTFTWDAATVCDQVDASQFFIDKQWLAVDSLSGNLYLSYTLFTAFDDSIVFQRSTDNGATWSPRVSLSSDAAAGFVQGSRPAVGPDGEVHVIWSEIGLVDQDYFRIRSSTDGGVTWGPEITQGGRFTNFGTGAPGFNRERSVDFPSIVVDRTRGPHRGRVYVTWHESINWYDDPFGGGGSRNEVESNNTFSTATLFTPGQTLRGTITSSDTQDWFRWNATQGTTYMFWVDSIPRPLYSARIYCTDGGTRLQLAGDFSTPAGGNSFLVFTAPATATYYFRMSFVTGALTSGGYRVLSAVNTPGPEIARDHRDVIVSHSDDAVSWSTPVRVNDDPGWFDGWLPEVGVGADGYPYAIWFDWRDAVANCGGSSHMYATRSTDGGATWAASQRFTDQATAWSSVGSNIAPNQGDYSHVFGDERYIRPTWSDGRVPPSGTTDPDVFVTAIDTWHTIASCPPDTTLAPTGTLDLTVSATNLNPLFANAYAYTITSDRGWTLASGSLGTAAEGGGIASAPTTITVPDTAAAGPVQVCINVVNAAGLLQRSCCFQVTVSTGNVSVGDAAPQFALMQNAPNPVRGGATRIAFTLPREGRVRLEVFGLHGERVRTLVDGAAAAGPNSVTWDGRDGNGVPVPAGAYFLRLSGFGQAATRRMVVLP